MYKRQVKGLSLELHKGEFLALLGGNGTSKTTTLKLLANLKKAYRGELAITGTVGMLPQDVYKRQTYTIDKLTVSTRIEVEFTNGKLPFTDVRESDWFYEDVAFAYENGLFAGTSDTTFSPVSYTHLLRTQMFSLQIMLLIILTGQTISFSPQMQPAACGLLEQRIP